MVWADLPLAKLVSVFPPGAQAGTTNEVSVTGSDLDEPSGLRFSDPRLTARPQPGNPAAFLVSIPADVTSRLVDLRFTGRFGVSNPRAFAVGDQPELAASTTNTTPESALQLPLDTVANGRAVANNASWFRFSAKAGQRVVARLQARELDSRLEPILRVRDLAGQELAQSRRGLLEFTAPTDGSYLFQVHDVTFRGGEDFVFRLTVTSRPSLDFALPGVLRAGETNRVTLFGRNLPAGAVSKVTGADGIPLEEVTVEIVAPAWGVAGVPPAELLRKPAAAALAETAFAWRWSTTNGVANPLLFTLTTNAVAGMAAGAAGLVPVTPPVEVSGLFPARGELGGVTFAAKKGDRFWLELYADRLGFPCDPFALVQRQRGTKGPAGETLFADVLELNDSDANLGGVDFNTATRDPAARFEAPEDGTYRVLVQDLFNPGANRPRYPYRLSVRRAAPDFALVAVPLQPPRANDNDRNVYPMTPWLRRGETMRIKVLALRRDGFGGEIELGVTNLPPGVTAVGTRIPAGQDVGSVLLTASDDAVGVMTPRIFGRAQSGPEALVHPASLITVAWPVADYNEQIVAARVVREPLMAVSGVEFAPVELRPDPKAKFEAPPDGKLSVPLTILRRGDFNGAFNLKLAGRAELEKTKEVNVAEKATNATVEINLAEAKLPAGTHTVWLQGTVAGKYRNNPEALAAAEAELKAAEQALAAASAADKAGLEQRKKTAEELRKAAEERAKPRDVTLLVYSRPFEVTILPPPPPAEVKK